MELKRKGNCVLVLQRAGRQFTRRNKSKCLVHECFLGHFLTMQHREDFEQMGLARFSHTLVYNKP